MNVCIHIYIPIYIYTHTHTHIYRLHLTENTLSLTKFNPFMLYVDIQTMYSNIHVQYIQTSSQAHQPRTNYYEQ